MTLQIAREFGVPELDIVRAMATEAAPNSTWLDGRRFSRP
jgi:hypothetical protein